jgi:hypothetical protein
MRREVQSVIISLALTLHDAYCLDLRPTDLDSRDWLLDHETTYSRVCNEWFDRWKFRPILISSDCGIREMRDDLLAALRATFPRIHFVITAKMPVRRTVTEMVTVR